MKKDFELMVKLFNELPKGNHDDSTLTVIKNIGILALNTLSGTDISFVRQGNIDSKVYNVYHAKVGNSKRFSRPVLEQLFITDSKIFTDLWDRMITKINSRKRLIEDNAIGSLIYTVSQAFSCAFDIYKPGSRKTPGTFFEIIITVLLSLATRLPVGKQIEIPGEKYKVPTDIVLYAIDKEKPSLVIPTKITTRERIVQPWAHQRIVNDVYGDGKFATILVCISELQRDGEQGVNEICVPNQVGLFQAHMSKLSGLYYADPPISYVNASFHDLPVKSLDDLFQTDLPKLLGY